LKSIKAIRRKEINKNVGKTDDFRISLKKKRKKKRRKIERA